MDWAIDSKRKSSSFVQHRWPNITRSRLEAGSCLPVARSGIPLPFLGPFLTNPAATSFPTFSFTLALVSGRASAIPDTLIPGLHSMMFKTSSFVTFIIFTFIDYSVTSVLFAYFKAKKSYECRITKKLIFK